MTLDYLTLFKDFKDTISTDDDLSAKDITSRIKEYFANKYNDRTVLYSKKSENQSEYLTDVLVTDFKPKNVVSKLNDKFKVSEKNIKALLAVESELGGEGGTSAGPVLKNVIEDFIKLLLIKSKYKILVFSSVPLKDEEEYLLNRVNTLKEVKESSDSSNEDILLIHLFGKAHKSSSGNPRQIKVNLISSGIKGFLLKNNNDIVELNA